MQTFISGISPHPMPGARSSSLTGHLTTWLTTEWRKPNAYLLPIRVFIAVGWLRAALEKWIDPDWHSGVTLTTFLNDQLHSGQVVFPAYEALMEQIFLPGVETLSLIILLGQGLVGLALLLGICTVPALIGGIWMNLNFLLAGRPDPNAFYLLIQAMLWAGDAGSVCSVGDLWRSSLKLSQPAPSHLRPLLSGVGAVAFVGLALYAFRHITQFDPAASVHDPAAVLFVLCHVGAGLSIMNLVRQRSPNS